MYGKIKKVTRSTGSTKADLEFGYDAMGNRLWKKVIPAGGNAADIKIYYYLRDAQGNEMSRYIKYTHNTNGTTYESREHSIYGSSRLGIDNNVQVLYTSGAQITTLPTTYERPLGMKSYELSNHLGNVLVTVSDKKVYKNGGSYLYFEAEITSITDYYPFGSVIQSRTYSSGAYRFGFNNQEKDGELGDAYAFEYRIHDARLGRFLSVDPLMNDYPWSSVYAFAENEVIDCIDLEGLERFWTADGKFLGKNGTSTDIYIMKSDWYDAWIASGRTRDHLVQCIVKPPNKNTIKILKEMCVRAYLDNEENRLKTLRNWAEKNRNTSNERVMSLFKKSIINSNGIGYSTVFVEGSTGIGETTINPEDCPRVSPELSVSPLKGWERYTTIHTHPSGPATNFSNEYETIGIGGDLQWSLRHNCDLYLVPPSGNEMGKFSPEKYKIEIYKTLKEHGGWSEEDLDEMCKKNDYPNPATGPYGDGSVYKNEVKKSISTEKIKP